MLRTKWSEAFRAIKMMSVLCWDSNQFSVLNTQLVRGVVLSCGKDDSVGIDIVETNF